LEQGQDEEIQDRAFAALGCQAGEEGDPLDVYERAASSVATQVQSDERARLAIP
jgi:hypothetical protein